MGNSQALLNFNTDFHKKSYTAMWVVGNLGKNQQTMEISWETKDFIWNRHFDQHKISLETPNSTPNPDFCIKFI